MKLTKKQIALSNFPYYKYSLRYTLDSLQRIGADAIELYAVEPHFHIDDSGLPELMSLKRQIRQRGMRVICLTPEQMKYPINIASSNPAGRSRSVGVFTKCIQYASELECPVVLFHVGYPLNDERYEDAWARSAESLSHLTRIAEGYGVTITAEFVNVRWKTVLRNSQKAAEMIRQIGSPNLRGMIDTITLATSGETVDEAVRNLEGNLAHCHFTDGSGRPDVLAHLVPGEGELDLCHIIDALGSAGYKGYLSVELMSPYEDNPEEAMQKSAAWLRAHLV
ncbi:sugar phosphate isomerase/epimerase family protein [Anaerotruncus rubiinfantis]|uniref:sugar phosphate isomerase/epimerase family protein n=1 Tax=Anaerotruncus rubiinfantis TaxID=1720200 RepID=UPI0034A5A238